MILHRQRARLVGLLLMAILVLCANGHSQMPLGENPLKPRLVANARVIKAGERFLVGVFFELPKPWHIYWKYPGDAGLATKISFSVPENFTVGKVNWPLPKQFVQPGNIVGYGYEHEALFFSEVTAPLNPEAASVLIKAEVRWLACSDVCIPGRTTLDLSLPVTAGSAASRGSGKALGARAAKGDPSSSNSGNVSVTSSPYQPALFSKYGGLTDVDFSPAQAPFLFESTFSTSLKDPSGTQVRGVLVWQEAPVEPQWFVAVPQGAKMSEQKLSSEEKRTVIEFRISLPAPPPKSIETLVLYGPADRRKGVTVPIALE